MKKSVLCVSMMFAAGTLFAADAKDEISAAAKKLSEEANYSWTSTVSVPEDRPFRPGPTDGMAEKDGYVCVKSSFGDITMQVVKKGEKTVFTNRDGEWQSLDEAEGPGRFMVRNVETPAEQVTSMLTGVKEFKADGDAISGDLTEDGAKSLMRFRRGGDGGGPDIADAKGSVKFWIKDGMLTKYELKVSGKMDFNGNEFNMDRTTTVEIKDVGTTKIEVPEGAKEKLS